MPGRATEHDYRFKFVLRQFLSSMVCFDVGSCVFCWCGARIDLHDLSVRIMDVF